MYACAESYKRFLEGDKKSFEDIVDTFSHHLTYFIVGYVHDLEIAEDITSEVFLSLIIKNRKLKNDDSFKTYLFTTARNKALNYIKKNKRLTTFALEDNDSAEADNLAESVVSDDNKKQLLRAVAQLNADYQEVLKLIYFEDMSYKDVASVMKLKLKQVDNIVYRAKVQLKSILEKEGFVYED